MNDIQQNSPEWLEWRRKGIGASDVAAIIGVCKYSTPYRVWSEKVGLSKGFEGNFATEKGKDLEAKARARYEMLSLEDMPPALAVHPEYEILRASLDGRRADGRLILEIKVPGRESHSAALSGKVPDHYLPQVQFQLAVTGADMCHYFSFSDADQTDVLVEIVPDIEYQGRLIARALDFWKLVESNTPPPLTEDDDKIINTGEAFDLCQVLIARKDALPKGAVEAMKEKVIRLGGHSRVRCGRALVTRSRLASGKESLRLTVSKDKGIV